MKFDQSDWEQVVANLGNTSVLSLLYRKRIKANYRGIETFLSPKLDGSALFKALRRIVASINAVHEMLIAKSVGSHTYNQLIASVPASEFDFVTARQRLFQKHL